MEQMTRKQRQTKHGKGRPGTAREIPRSERRRRMHFAGRMNTRGQFWGNPSALHLGIFGNYLKMREMSGRNVRWARKWLKGKAERKAK